MDENVIAALEAESATSAARRSRIADYCCSGVSGLAMPVDVGPFSNFGRRAGFEIHAQAVPWLIAATGAGMVVPF
jgi:hypothetical protein